MKTSELLLSGLHITEDDYIYRGTFILSNAYKSISVDISDLHYDEKISYLKTFFSLEEKNEEIPGILMDMVLEKSTICSRITES